MGHLPDTAAEEDGRADGTRARRLGFWSGVAQDGADQADVGAPVEQKAAANTHVHSIFCYICVL